MKALLLTAFAYLLGSVPFGVLFTRSSGIDITKAGSGNIGATNVLRAAGKGVAILTLLGDLLKGTASVALGRLFGVGPFYEGVIGLAAILGHDFSAFRRLRGGKGVATSLGVMLIYAPAAGILTVILWCVTVFVTRYSSLGALISFGSLPLVLGLLKYEPARLFISIPVSVLIFVKHGGNIKRLLSGKEHRIGG